jgi:hypothetical protein
MVIFHAMKPSIHPNFESEAPNHFLGLQYPPQVSVHGHHLPDTLIPHFIVEGELILIMEDGSETHLKNPGDAVIQKGTLHAWHNPSTGWARWMCVLIAAEPVVVEGKILQAETKT